MLRTRPCWSALLGAALAACVTPLQPGDAGNDAAGNDAAGNDAAGNDAAGHDGAPMADAGDATTPGGSGAIVAPAGVWTWVPVDGARCADGSPTGIGINLSPSGSHTLELYFEGGGACWDATSCFGAMPSAANLTGYGADRFASESRRTTNPLFHRDYAANPLRDATMVYVPYCTGDIHTGDRVATYMVGATPRMIHHVGGRNLDLAFARLHATDPAIDRVLVSGSSAGGFGSMLNWGRVSRAFAPARVDVLDDAGPAIEPVAGRWQTWTTAWGLGAPADCAACATSLGAWFEYLRAAHPTSHYGLLSFTSDTVIPGYMLLSAAQFTTELNAWATAADGTSNARYIFVNGSGHVTLVDLPNVDVVLFPWLTSLMGDGTGWQSARY